MMKGLNPDGNLQNNIKQKCSGGLVLQRNKDLDMNRSGSAPPTVEGALRAAENLFRNPNFVQFEDSGSNMNNSDSIGVMTEEEIRSHPAYLEYYYSNENLNPRMPPPLLSKEDWRVAQRFRAAGGTGDRGNESLAENGGSSSLFSMQPGLSVKKAEDELMELRKAALRNISRKSPADMMDKSFSNIVQDAFGQHMKSNLSRPSSRNSVGDVLDSMGTLYTNAEVQNMQESFEAMLPIKALMGSIDTENVASALSSSFASVKLSSSETELVRRSTSPVLAGVGNKAHPGNNMNSITSNTSNFTSSAIFNGDDITASLSGLSMSNGQFHTGDMLKSSHQVGSPGTHQQNQQHHYFDKSRTEKLVNNYGDLTRKNGQTRSLNISNSLINESTGFPRTPSMTILQSQLNPSEFAYLEDLQMGHQGDFFPGGHFSCHMQNGYGVNGKADMMTSNGFGAGSHLTGSTVKGQNQRNNNQGGIHYPGMDPHHIQYIHGRNMVYIPGSSPEGRFINNLYDPGNMQALERAYLETLHVQQNQQYHSHLLHKPNQNNLNHGNPAYVPYVTQYQESRMPNPLHTKISSKCSMFQNDKTSQLSLSLRRMKGESAGLLHTPSGKVMSSGCESLLEAVKNNKPTLELLDVLNYAVEFSMDQYGSRFIQQKLETATIDERMKIFKEIFPHARTLMVDVFGNYVVQKFLEHGTDSQRKELAGLVIGHVLPLSLQMYGCRVIQKALEVVDVELQTVMVAELDGSVMKCVRDQNGNHVIQKCIECIPHNQVQSIILSFLGQIVTLSMHPYGCRVVQRVLEHCDDPKTQQIIMDEIMSSVYKLAQDQYGNYVIQHVLQHGKPHERTAIISKLAGQIVKMSQQKFASNVVEKCLTFGGPEQRKLLVNEMLGSTAENEPLQTMMRDPFGNYVVQKVLETCDDKSRELVMSRIKVHLDALKKYTYGKHIVTSVEKLVATGERHTSEMIQV